MKKEKKLGRTGIWKDWDSEVDRSGAKTLLVMFAIMCVVTLFALIVGLINHYGN